MVERKCAASNEKAHGDRRHEKKLNNRNFRRRHPTEGERTGPVIFGCTNWRLPNQSA